MNTAEKLSVVTNYSNAFTEGAIPTDFSAILRHYGLENISNEYHLQVGGLKQTQGWILHISVVLYQIVDSLSVIIPLLVEKRVAFKIPESLAVCSDILSGNFGISQIGKIITIFPETDETAVCLAEQLIDRTRSFKGPRIPTDRCLGSIVYTRYGSFEPILRIDPSGNKEKYIYNAFGGLIKDTYTIPFELPEGILWPFDKLAKVSDPISFKYSHRLRPLSMLKADSKGNVYRGLYLSSIFKIRKCVIKQGIENMNSDFDGRDIRDRLMWQKELHTKLYKSIPVPKIYDFIEQEGASYLVMEYIKGISLFSKIREINPTSKSWQEYQPAEAAKIFKYLKEIVRIIDQLHRLGYVHRDIVPVNFLIDNHDRIKLIDLELTYSLTQSVPSPPFALGTEGFMSPEQREGSHPTVKEDIYALGACLVEIFTGLTPIKFNTRDKALLMQQLCYFVRDARLSNTIISCFDDNPTLRPTIQQISEGLEIYRKKILNTKQVNVTKAHPPSVDAINAVIAQALNGLVKGPIPFKDGLWYSSKQNVMTASELKSKQYAKYPYLWEGMGGVMYMLSRLHKSGINIGSRANEYFNGWAYLKQTSLELNSDIPPGLYDGAYGIAIVIAYGLQSLLLDDSDYHRTMLKRCLSIPSIELNVATGLSGQGIALLQSKAHLDDQEFDSMLNLVKTRILQSQNSDGSWSSYANSDNFDTLLSFGYGLPGITWFLLEYGNLYKDDIALSAGKKTLDWIIANKLLRNRITGWVAFKKEVKGMILALLKGYEVFDDKHYKTIVEKSLLLYPSFLVRTDFTQKSGIAGMGEVYLEAYKVLKDEKWRARADWIVNVLLNSFYKSADNTGHWVLEENSPPTADFAIGISGIIHFLSRHLSDANIGYPLLN